MDIDDDDSGSAAADEADAPIAAYYMPPEQYDTRTIGGPSTSSQLNDEDARCYSSRYQDIDAMLDPKSHYSTTGIQQGRLGTCAKRLTDYQVGRLLGQNPELQRMYGRSGPSALQQTREHWTNGGYKNTAFVKSIDDKDNEPFKCASNGAESCLCPGTLWFGLATRPDNGAHIESFDEMREWRTLSSESDDWQACSMVEFGSDPLPGAEKQCFCEAKPQDEAVRCADEGDDCMCNGHVYFSSRFQEDHSTPATFIDVLESGFAIIDANNTGSVSCSSDSFEGSDPSPETAKQCFCDDKKHFTTQSDAMTIMDYWRSQNTLSQTESEIYTITSAVSEASYQEQQYAETITWEEESGDVDATTAGCNFCDESCAADTEKTLTTEIEKQKTVITTKYNKMIEVNKHKKVTSHNKRIAGDNACAQSQRAKDPAEKKKQRRMCTDLREEATRINTEAEIEYSNIIEQRRTEESHLTEETTRIISDQTTKTTSSKKTQEVNRAKLREQQSQRITKETEERISLIKKKIETEKIEQSITTTQTTAYERQVTNIQHQIEQVENTLTREIKEEREESYEAGEETDTTAIESEEEITTLIEEKRTDLTSKKEKTTSKIETLTSKTTELEEHISSVTKEITDIRTNIEHTTTSTTTYVHQREEKKQYIKTCSTSERTKIQEEIDELTTKITTGKKEIEELTTKREEKITEETTTRTDLTYTSQTLKKTQVYQEHIEEQIIVTDVVINSKKEKVKEETEKKEIIEKQITCYKKQQELVTKKEEVKQFKSTINKKINKKHHIREEAEVSVKTYEEDLKIISSKIHTYEEQVKNIKNEEEKTIITSKIETLKKEETTTRETVDHYTSTITSITTEITDLESGKTIHDREEEIKKLEEEVTTTITDAHKSIEKLPLIKSETETTREITESGKEVTTSTTTTSTTSTTTTHPGVITGITIKGDIGGTTSTTTTTSTGGSDISVQIIEVQETATKLREEATKIE